MTSQVTSHIELGSAIAGHKLAREGAQARFENLPGSHLLSRLLSLVLAASALCLAPRAPADEVTQGPDYISVVGGYVHPDDDLRTTGSGATLSGIFGHEFTRHLGLEVNLQTSTFETGADSGSNFYQNGATIDLTLSPWERRNERSFTPFFLVGVGGVDDDFHPYERSVDLLADAGVGVVSKPLFADAIRLRIEARYVYDSVHGGHSEPRFVAGIEIPLRRTVHSTVYLPGKIEIREVVREVQVPAPAPPPVIIQRCHGAPEGAAVDADGCLIKEQTITLNGVTFDFNKARLTPNAETVLDTVAGAFRSQPTLKVEIAGHTDSIGSEAANLILSQKRAESVRAYLILRGATPKQLDARGYGKSQLLVNPELNDTDRERNRRVELRVIAP